MEMGPFITVPGSVIALGICNIHQNTEKYSHTERQYGKQKECVHTHWQR